MQDEHLKRIRRDLEIVEQATGLKPAYHPREVWLHCACIPTGVMAALWGLLMPHSPPQWGLLPTFVVCLGYFLLVRRDWHHAVPRNTQRQSYILMGLILALVVLFVFWARQQAMSALAIRSGATLACGGLLITLALVTPNRFYQLGAGVSFLIAGLVMPFCGLPWVVPYGVAISVAGALSAAIQFRELRSAHIIPLSLP